MDHRGRQGGTLVAIIYTCPVVRSSCCTDDDEVCSRWRCGRGLSTGDDRSVTMFHGEVTRDTGADTYFSSYYTSNTTKTNVNYSSIPCHTSVFKTRYIIPAGRCFTDFRYTCCTFNCHGSPVAQQEQNRATMITTHLRTARYRVSIVVPAEYRTPSVAFATGQQRSVRETANLAGGAQQYYAVSKNMSRSNAFSYSCNMTLGCS